MTINKIKVIFFNLSLILFSNEMCQNSNQVFWPKNGENFPLAFDLNDNKNYKIYKVYMLNKIKLILFNSSLKIFINSKLKIKKILCISE